MVFFITTRKPGNWWRFNGQLICFLERGSSLTGSPSTGQPINMGGKYTLHCSRLTTKHICFTTRVACARQVACTWRCRYFGALMGCARGSTSLNAQQAVVATCISWFTHTDTTDKLIFKFQWILRNFMAGPTYLRCTILKGVCILDWGDCQTNFIRMTRNQYKGMIDYDTPRMFVPTSTYSWC